MRTASHQTFQEFLMPYPLGNPKKIRLHYYDGWFRRDDSTEDVYPLSKLYEIEEDIKIIVQGHGTSKDDAVSCRTRWYY